MLLKFLAVEKSPRAKSWIPYDLAAGAVDDDDFREESAEEK